VQIVKNRNIMDEQTSILSQANELLKEVIDPEIGINIVDLGLVYELSLSEDKEIKVTMTLTTPGCPMHESIAVGVQSAILDLDTVKEVEVDLVWDPPWRPAKMSEEGRARRGIYES